MSRNRKMDFAAGIQDGIPICLGYIAVSFTFGIMAKNAGLSTWEAVLISLTNLTSAGQFAGLSLITAHPILKWHSPSSSLISDIR